MEYKNEDTNLNDFLFICEQFRSRPCKVALTFNFKAIEFKEYITSKNCLIKNILTEVVSADEESIVNEKYLISLGTDIFMTYTHLDKSVETGFISNVSIYYKLSCLDMETNPVSVIMQELNDLIFDVEEDDNKINMIVSTPNGLVLEPLPLVDANYENIEYYFNDSTLKSANKLVKKINKNKKGLSIIHGRRGTGKTVLTNYIANLVDRIVIFIPISMIDITINNPEFLVVCKEYNPLIIIDDCEILTDMFSKSNITYANILQMVDGFYSDSIETHIILSYNTDSEDDIDEDILDANNLLKVIKVGPLKKTNATELCKHLSIEHKAESELYLIDILNKNFEDEHTKIGYE
jgi:hypothetical protein